MNNDLNPRTNDDELMDMNTADEQDSGLKGGEVAGTPRFESEDDIEMDTSEAPSDFDEMADEDLESGAKGGSVERGLNMDPDEYEAPLTPEDQSDASTDDYLTYDDER